MKVIVLAMLLLSACALPSFAEDSDKGRFQLFEGTLPGLEHRALLKIDTATGEVWECVRHDTKEKGVVFEWVKLSEPAPEGARKVPFR